MTELEKLNALAKIISKITKVKASEIIKKLDEADNDLEETFDTAIEDSEKSSFEDGRRAVKGEFSKFFKKNGLDVKVDKIDDNLATAMKDAFKGDASQADESEVVKALKQEVVDLKKSISTKDQELEDALDKRDRTHKQEITKMGLGSKVSELLGELNAKQPEDAQKAKLKIEKFLKAEGINDLNWSWDAGKKDYVVVDEDGNTVREGGKAKTLSDIVSANIEYHYEIVVASPKGSSGLPSSNGKGLESKSFEWKTYKGEIPKTREDVDKILDDPKGEILAQSEVLEYWNTVGSLQK